MAIAEPKNKELIKLGTVRSRRGSTSSGFSVVRVCEVFATHVYGNIKFRAREAYPGQRVRFVDDCFDEVRPLHPGKNEMHHAIIDPYADEILCGDSAVKYSFLVIINKKIITLDGDDWEVDKHKVISLDGEYLS